MCLLFGFFILYGVTVERGDQLSSSVQIAFGITFLVISACLFSPFLIRLVGKVEKVSELLDDIGWDIFFVATLFLITALVLIFQFP